MTPKIGNIKINHLHHLKGLIKEYSSETILKEYLQNADDAGATELVVTYDKQIHAELIGTDYEDIACPSLLLSNNAKFNDKDFDSILELYAENKIENSQSTGRFGLGFRSSYSITDYPSILSSNTVIWLDDLQETICKNSTGTYARWEKDSFSDSNIQKWLNTFKVVNYDDSQFFNKTIFRLPLRTDKTALTSKLSTEVFSFDKFLHWCEEWKNNSRDLLFLRNINRLILQEINEDGKRIIHLDIKTKNIEKIEKIKNNINSQLSQKAIDTCDHWLSNNIELPRHIYTHIFSITSYCNELKNSIVKKEKWAVINGLFRGNNDILLLQAKKALAVHSNVLPWVGVAIQIDENNIPIKIDGSWYTFLPLFKSKHPVLLHGWFDLDNGRTKIVHDGTSDELEILKKWNELLLEEGVGIAWALLLDSIKSENNIKTYYKFWVNIVDDTKIDSKLESCLIKGFYLKMAELNCLYVTYKEKKEWLSPKEIDLHYFKDEKNEILLNAFEKHFPIILPKPQKHIIENFENVDIKLTEITSNYVRSYLSQESNTLKFPKFLDEVPISMLSKKEWLLEILNYCADNGEDYSLLKGLPLELTLDNNVYKIGSDTLVDQNPNLKLFQDMKYLFVDIDIVNSIEEKDNLPISWLRPSIKNQIKLLSTPSYWEKLAFSKEWIKEIVDLIVDSNKEEYDEAEDEIKKLQIVYQENDEYRVLQSDIENYSPYMPRDEDIENNLIYLKEIEMNIIHHDYVEIYKPLLKYGGLITQLTSYTLIQHLLLLDSFEFFKKKETREYLMDILTEDISWFKDLSDYEKATLNSMPFIETVTDNIYNKNTDTKLFLPTNFTPPKHIKSIEGEYEIISVEKNTNLYELYRKMGFTEQNIDSYIQEIIIPFLKNSDNANDKKETLKWLATEWNHIKEAIKDDTLDKLKDTSIIPSLLDMQSLYRASELYIPTIELPNILNDNRYKSIYFEDEKTQENWVFFLKDLGASPIILALHIKDKVKQITEENSKKDAISLLNYIANNFEIFEQLNILDTLSKYSWYPVEEAKDLLKPKYTYTELKKADELILYDDLKIAGGYYHILDRSVKLGKKDEKSSLSEKDMAGKLGLITNIPNESFFESFQELMKLSPTDGQVVNYAKEIYKYIGRRFKDETIDFDIEEKTILINNQWLAPKYVYQDEINLTDIYSWSSLVGNEKESNLAKGLILLGVQEKPTFDFLIELLKRLPQEQNLNSNQLKDAKALLTEIQKKDENLIYEQLPLLTGENQLVLSFKLYINDLPAYKNATDKNHNLKFCQNQFEKLAKRLEVKSLSENYTSAIFDYVECECNHDIVNILKNDSFKEAILRLLYHEQKIKENEINESILHDVLPSNLTFVNNLVIEYSIDNIFLYRSNETTYESKKENCLYIFEQNDNEDMIEAITGYICKGMNLDKYNLLIARILRETMNKLEIDNFLEKKKIKPLPLNFDIYDEVSLFSTPNTKQFDEDFVYDTSMSQEKNHVQLSRESKEDIAPPIKPKTTSENLSAKNHSEGNSGSSSYSSINKNSSNTNNKKIISSNDRKPVYVGKDKEVDEKQEKSQRENAKEIGDKGENYVLAHKENLLLLKDNYFQKTPTNNEGFDIYEKDNRGQIIRYIEVKTLTGQWGQGGVGITEHQLKFAQKEKDKWWLFVVENINTDNTRVYQFKNPILEANRFMFDNSWKQLAYQSDKGESQEPKIDDKYEVEVDGTMTTFLVTNVKPRGALFKVDLILENGKEIKKKKFDKSWRKIDG